MKDFSGMTHNKAKLALGSLSIIFDLIFLVQHYCLYSTNAAEDGSGDTTIRTEQNEPLLPRSIETVEIDDVTRSYTEEEEEREEGSTPPESSSSEPQTIFV